MVRLESGWRKTALVLTGIGSVLTICVTAWLWWVVRSAPADAVQTMLDQVIFDNGWRPKFSIATVFTGLTAATLVLTGIWWLLFCPTTRTAFAAPSEISER